MAKILEGPLAASLSGRIGPVVFSRTRFGQVVQSAPRRVVHTTAAALATKAAFRNAQNGYSRLGDLHQSVLKSAAAIAKTTPSGMVVSAFLRALNDGSAEPRLNYNAHFIATWGAPFFALGRWHVPCSSLSLSHGAPNSFVIPVSAEPFRIYGAAFEDFYLKTFSLPPVATSPGAVPPFVLLSHDFHAPGQTIPPPPVLASYAGLVAVYAP